jgi:hypothetical protein
MCQQDRSWWGESGAALPGQQSPRRKKEQNGRQNEYFKWDTFIFLNTLSYWEKLKEIRYIIVNFVKLVIAGHVE